MINVSTVAPNFRRLAKEAPPSPARTWKVRVVIGIREGNLGTTYTINVANASVMEREKENGWYRLSVVKLKHTAAGWKPCVNLATISKGNPCAIFPHRVLQIWPFALCARWSPPEPPAQGMFPGPYAIRDIAHGTSFLFATGGTKKPDL
jgi:hypothetical protein